MDANEVREEGRGSGIETREDGGEEAGTKRSNISGCSAFVIAQINVGIKYKSGETPARFT